jgi:hypothetical protein
MLKDVRTAVDRLAQRVDRVEGSMDGLAAAALALTPRASRSLDRGDRTARDFPLSARERGRPPSARAIDFTAALQDDTVRPAKWARAPCCLGNTRYGKARQTGQSALSSQTPCRLLLREAVQSLSSRIGSGSGARRPVTHPEGRQVLILCRPRRSPQSEQKAAVASASPTQRASTGRPSGIPPLRFVDSVGARMELSLSVYVSVSVSISVSVSL